MRPIPILDITSTSGVTHHRDAVEYWTMYTVRKVPRAWHRRVGKYDNADDTFD